MTEDEYRARVLALLESIEGRLRRAFPAEPVYPLPEEPKLQTREILLESLARFPGIKL